MPNVLIIEDDVDFADGFLSRLNEVWIDDFDMLFLNGTHGNFRKPTGFNKDWLQVGELYGAFGYIVHSRFYDEILHWLKTQSKPTDSVYAMFMNLYKVYKLRKPLIFHKPGMSDIQGIVPKNYKHLEKRLSDRN